MAAHPLDYRRIADCALLVIILAMLFEVPRALRATIGNALLREVIDLLIASIVLAVSVTWISCRWVPYSTLQPCRWAHRLYYGLVTSVFVACILGGLQVAAEALSVRVDIANVAFMLLGFAAAAASASMVLPFEAIKRSILFVVSRRGVAALLIMFGAGGIIGAVLGLLSPPVNSLLSRALKALIPAAASVFVGVLVLQQSRATQQV